MSKTPFLIATVFALCATTTFADHAEARERSRAVQRTAQGGSVAVDRNNARFDSQRQRAWQADGQGNATGSRSGSIAGGIGRDADGNVSGARDTTATGANGNGYTGSTTVSGGTVTHTGTCTNASGETITCPRGH